MKQTQVGGSTTGGKTGVGGVGPGGEVQAPTGSVREEGGLWVLEVLGRRMEIDPALGGRVLSLKLDGVELLTGPDVNDVNFGSTYWTSPQTDWNWPPVVAIDTAAYTVTPIENGIEMASPRADFASMQVTVKKRFVLDPEGKGFDIEYLLRNAGTAPITLASWEVTRVWLSGLTFYPTGDHEFDAMAPIPRTHQLGVTWFDHGDFQAGAGAKTNADGKEGWLAHVYERILFVKTFEDLPLSVQAPGEGEVEIFAHENATYVEVENQSAYVELAPGSESSYRVGWRLHALPSDLTVAPGSTELLDFVRATLP